MRALLPVAIILQRALIAVRCSISWWTRPHSHFPRNGFTPGCVELRCLMADPCSTSSTLGGKGAQNARPEKAVDKGGRHSTDMGDKSPSKRRSPKSGHIVCMRLRESCDSAKECGVTGVVLMDHIISARISKYLWDMRKADA